LLHAARCPNKKRVTLPRFPANKHVGPVCILTSDDHNPSKKIYKTKDKLCHILNICVLWKTRTHHYIREKILFTDIYNIQNSKCLEVHHPWQHVAVDEVIISFKWKIIFQQYMKKIKRSGKNKCTNFVSNLVTHVISVSVLENGETRLTQILTTPHTHSTGTDLESRWTDWYFITPRRKSGIVLHGIWELWAPCQ
jgi:hypothetical protein